MVATVGNLVEIAAGNDAVRSLNGDARLIR
jgi:hypothetical protein